MGAVNKKETRALLDEMGLRPNKKLGQNFLCSGEVLRKIVEAARIGPGDLVLEIGPGLGALTEELACRAGRVTAVEIDSGFFRYLREKFGDTLDLHHADFLKASFGGEFTKAVSNLPYYCSSEILFRLAEEYRMGEVYVMLQKEMAARIWAKPGSDNYGALTVSLGLHFEAARLFDIDRSAFLPEPDVKSSFLRLVRKVELPDPETVRLFHALVKSAFWGRRKPLSSALARSPHIELEKDFVLDACGKAGIDPGVRGEELGLEEYLRLARTIKETGAP
jgi:16S rRNA (adenine1518-N6/adenine1519-N6)-dimethyltransferase